MSGKSHGTLGDGPAGKAAGSLEKPPADDLAGDLPDSADATDMSSYSSYGGGSGSDGDAYGYGGGSAEGQQPGQTGTGDDDTSGKSEPESELEAETEASDDGGTGDPSSDDAGSDDAGSDAGGNEDNGHEYTPQPDQHPTGNDNTGDTGDGGSTDDTQGSGRVSIDIQAMTTLIAAMERARDQLPEYQAEFHKILTDVELREVAELEAERLADVTAWIEDELPRLRRRLALAQAIEDDTKPRSQPHQPGERRPVQYNEHQVTGNAPHVSAESGRDAGSWFATQPDHSQVSQLVAQLKGNQHDPYFAHQFTGEADPAVVAAALDAARARDDVDQARVDELSSLIATTVRTAARCTGDLAPDEGFEQHWAQFAPEGGTAQPAASPA